MAAVPRGRPGQWVLVEPDAIEIAPEWQAWGGARRYEILKLIRAYGQWSSVVATESGRVIVGGLYGQACWTLGEPAWVRYVPADQADAIVASFSRPYGEFDYQALPRNPWIQSFAQMNRLRSEERGKGSRTYETAVIPNVSREMRILDFGAGHGDYAAKLRRDGFDVRDLEFYRRKPGTNILDVAWTNRAIDQLCRDLETRGRYDVVVCDSVINSVDSIQAESDVLTTINALTRPGGLLVFSGRVKEPEQLGAIIENNKFRRYVEFYDRNNLTAVHNGQGWFYQRVHEKDEIPGLGTRWIGGGATFKNFGVSFAVWGYRRVELDPARVEEALGREFDLPLPGGRTYGRGQDVVRAWRAALALERQNSPA